MHVLVVVLHASVLSHVLLLHVLLLLQGPSLGLCAADRHLRNKQTSSGQALCLCPGITAEITLKQRTVTAQALVCASEERMKHCCGVR